MNANRKEQFKIRFETHYPRLCQIAFGYVACREDAEDIVQELFVGIWNREADLMPEKDFAAYITTAVKNSCISFLRKKQDSTVSIDDHPAAASTLPDEEHDPSAPSPEELLNEALSQLPPKCREIFLMAKQKGMKYKEIAAALELSEKTIENQMTKAIKLLREFVSRHGAVLLVVAVIVLSVIANCE